MPQSRSRIEYLIPSDSIIVLDRHFNLMKKSISLAGCNMMQSWLTF